MRCPDTEAVLREAKEVRNQLKATLKTLEQFEQRLRAVTREQGSGHDQNGEGFCGD